MNIEQINVSPFFIDFQAFGQGGRIGLIKAALT